MKNKIKVLFPAFAIFILASLMLYILSPFFITFVIGAMMSVVLYPYYARLIKWQLGRPLSAVIVIFCFCALLVVPLGFALTKGATSTIEIINSNLAASSQQQDGPEIPMGSPFWRKLNRGANILTDRFGMDVPSPEEYAKNLVKEIAAWALDVLKLFFAQIPSLLLGFFVMLVIVYFGLVEATNARYWAERLSFLSGPRRHLISKILAEHLKSIFYSNVVTGLIQALIVAAGTAIAGTADPFLVAFITFICSFVPVIGAGPVALVLGGYELYEANYFAASILIGAGIFAGTIDNILRPYMLSGSADMHPLLGFLAILGGIALLGLPGLFLGPLLVSLALALIPVYVDELKEHWQSR